MAKHFFISDEVVESAAERFEKLSSLLKGALLFLKERN